MAEDEAVLSTPPPSPPHLEVLCKSSGKIRRFSVGCEAGFALSVINKKLDLESPIALYIEAVKADEEPISFGPNSLLIDYGKGWKLQTVTGIDYGTRKEEGLKPVKMQQGLSVASFDLSVPTNSLTPQAVSFSYIGKIVIAFILMFVLGGILTLALDNLPQFLLLVRSYT